ncbi:MAG: hypothetical protein ACYS0H_22775 [Planctomycetota bacterium]|jgi:hypothetical protein
MMNKIAAIILTSVFVIVPVLAQQSGRDDLSPEPGVRFAPLHIYLDSGSRSLAAFQFELKATAGQIEIVGVEGGEHKAFSEAPYYDPAALAQDRIIIAAFNTGRDLPTGRTRIATIHLQITGTVEPQYELNLTVAGDADGEKIAAELAYEKGE